MKRMLKVKVLEKEYFVEVEELMDKECCGSFNCSCQMENLPEVTRPNASAEVLSEEVMNAPLPGVIVEPFVKEGDIVKVGDKVVVLEAMKMENILLAPCSGKVGKIHVKNGEAVGNGDPLITFTSA